MIDDQIIRVMYEHFERLFPKTCPNCRRCFTTIRKYVLNTKIGATISYDANLGDWETTQPLGTFVFAECPCGTTLTLSTEGMPLPKIHLMLKWIRAEMERRGLSLEELLGYVPHEIRKRALTDPV